MDQPSEYGIKCEPGMSLNSSCQAYGQDPSSEDLSADMDLSNFLDVDEQTLNGEGGRADARQCSSLGHTSIVVCWVTRVQVSTSI